MGGISATDRLAADPATGTGRRESNIFAVTVSGLGAHRRDAMAETQLDLREMPPPERHPKIFAAFEDLESGEALTIINDHDPKPLFYQMDAEIDSFDADGYAVEEVGPDEFVATLPKK